VRGGRGRLPPGVDSALERRHRGRRHRGRRHGVNLGVHGKVQEALNAYRELDAAADEVIRRNAKFNSGNLYLELALAARTEAHGDAGATLTLMELAKQSYRDVLREDSGDWDARYNLELALRLDPDPEEETPDLPVPPTRNQTPTVGLGGSLGLP
jgi:mxaK protein